MVSRAPCRSRCTPGTDARLVGEAALHKKRSRACPVLIQNRALDSCFDAFSSREPVFTSLENALAHLGLGCLLRSFCDLGDSRRPNHNQRE
jgi:hypothetical protein